MSHYQPKSDSPYCLMALLESTDNDGNLIELGYSGDEEVWKNLFEDYTIEMGRRTLGELLSDEYPKMPGVWVWEGVNYSSRYSTGVLSGSWRRATRQEVGDWLDWAERQGK